MLSVFIDSLSIEQQIVQTEIVFHQNCFAHSQRSNFVCEKKTKFVFDLEFFIQVNKISDTKMVFATKSITTSFVVLMTICILLTVTHLTEAGYRKPPFNGSIFGKRSGNSIG